MAKIDPTFELIKSLTKSEKRHFKVFGVGGSKNDSLYLNLFDLMDKKSEYEPAEMRRLFRNDDDGKKFSAAKKYLHHQLLSSLAQFHRNDSLENQFHEQLSHYRVLYGKGLYKQAEVALAKCKKMAERTVELPHQFAVVGLERNLITNNQSKQKKHEMLTSIAEEKAQIAKDIWIESELMQIHSHLHLLITRKTTLSSKTDKEFVEELRNNTVFKEAEKSNHPRVLAILHNVLNEYHFLKREYELSYEHLRKMVGVYYGNDQYRKTNARSFVAMVQNLCMRCIYIGKHEEAQHEIKRLEEFKPSSLTEESIVFECYYVVRFLLCRKTGDLSPEDNLVERFDEDLKRLQGGVNKAFELYLYGQVSVYQFLSSKYDDSLRWLNKYLLMGESDFVYIDKPVAEIYRLVILYEMEDPDFLASSIDSAKNHIARQDTFPRFSKLMLNFLQHSRKVTNTNERKKNFEILSKQLYDLENNSDEKPAFGLFEFVAWAEAHAEGIALTRLLAHKQVSQEAK